MFISHALPLLLLVQGGTLVLCPLSTLSQWHQEISDKSQEGALRVAEFYGANRQSFTAASLADYDIGTRHDTRHDSGQGSH